jgi:hypothetical protein
MRVQAIVGVTLIALGLLALASGAITYTRREKVLDLGPIEATAERHERIPLPPVLGVVAVAGGVVLLVVAARKR